MKNSPTLLIDGDIVLHRVLNGNETDIDWGDGVSTLHSNHDDCKAMVRSLVKEWCKHFETKDYRIAISGTQNFRKTLAVDYKGQRTGRKPIGWKPLRDWLFATGKAKSIEGIEADDLMGIWATHGKLADPVIVSDDKDLRQIPGKVYAPRKGALYTVSEEEGFRFHLHQTLVGDRTDNYPGCPGVGEVRAARILDEDCSWSAVVSAFVSAGRDADFALVQARLAKILQFENFDFKKRKPILWRPR